MIGDRAVPVIVLLIVIAGAFVIGSAWSAAGPDAGGWLESSELAGLGRWDEMRCGSCHAVLGRGGFGGPDLTRVLERRGALAVRALLVDGPARGEHPRVDRVAAYELTSWLDAVTRAADVLGVAGPGPFRPRATTGSGDAGR